MRHSTYHPWRAIATAIGLVTAGLGCFGAFEFAHGLEGRWSYLVIAGPVVAAAAALIPPLAEATWRGRERVKALLWWVILIPAGAVVFYSAAERVHGAKAGREAERTALRSAATRAYDALQASQRDVAKAQADAHAARGDKSCGPKCRAKWDDAVQAARERVPDAEAALRSAESAALQEASLQAPVWLLPAALDLIAFMAIWTGLSGPWRTRHVVQEVAPARKALVVKLRKAQPARIRPSVRVPTERVLAATRKGAANDNYHVASPTLH